ncbi:hypothetical protein L798_12785 [Zootermopsis nevadensis]|uniref:Uncharacterized protein n=1 Tax=Zootermopsis nevadensis TaxID=136037 RepID=A0A067RFY8_ZOONE|nr:hypothetical protein L798_12785 [Zootermopsis nevadensis]
MKVSPVIELLKLIQYPTFRRSPSSLFIAHILEHIYTPPPSEPVKYHLIFLFSGVVKLTARIHQVSELNMRGAVRNSHIRRHLKATSNLFVDVVFPDCNAAWSRR